ncbi:hypothetical protein D3C81_957990 [compost metagenome]
MFRGKVQCPEGGRDDTDRLPQIVREGRICRGLYSLDLRLATVDEQFGPVDEAGVAGRMLISPWFFASIVPQPAVQEGEQPGGETVSG